MFKIDSEKELLSFLKILSEESVKISKDSLNEKSSDSLSANFSNSLAAENELYEQEDDEDPELSAGQEPAKEPEVEPEAEQKSKQPEEELRASLDSLERNINTLRAGKSLKDSTVESQLEIYFDRLGEDEKSLMVLFIRELSKILSGEVTGDDAIDPNQEPYNLDVTQSDEEPEEVEPEQVSRDYKSSVADSEEEEEEEAEEAEEEEEEEEEEDTTPPIKVGDSQNLAEIRKKIKKLMRS